jgi:hypothetical protein
MEVMATIIQADIDRVDEQKCTRSSAADSDELEAEGAEANLPGNDFQRIRLWLHLSGPYCHRGGIHAHKGHRGGLSQLSHQTWSSAHQGIRTAYSHSGKPCGEVVVFSNTLNLP